MNLNEQTELEKTPRTDAETFNASTPAQIKSTGGTFAMPYEIVVDADFARTLERELNAATRRAAQAEKERDYWIYNANELQKGYNKLDKQLSSANEALKLAAESLRLCGIHFRSQWMPIDAAPQKQTLVALSHPAIQAILGKAGK